MSPNSQGDSLGREGRELGGHRFPCTGEPHTPSGLQETVNSSTLPLPASVIVLNQSNSFSKQVSSAIGCLGSARTAQRAGRSWEHSGSMVRLEIPAKNTSGPGPPHPSHRQPPCLLGPDPERPQSSEGATGGGDAKPQPGWYWEVVRSKRGPKFRAPAFQRGLRRSEPANVGLRWEGGSLMLTRTADSALTS